MADIISVTTDLQNIRCNTCKIVLSGIKPMETHLAGDDHLRSIQPTVNPNGNSATHPVFPVSENMGPVVPLPDISGLNLTPVTLEQQLATLLVSYSSMVSKKSVDKKLVLSHMSF